MSGKDMDEDWGGGDDDGGGGGDDDWGTGGAGGGGGGGGGGDGDDDWDEDGAGGGGEGATEWENADFDDNAEMAEDGEQELTVDIQIANIFYEAEGQPHTLERSPLRASECAQRSLCRPHTVLLRCVARVRACQTWCASTRRLRWSSSTAWSSCARAPTSPR